MKLIKKAIRFIKKIIRSKYFRAKFIYTNYYEKLSIKENEIVIQSYEGDSISGNPFYMLKELYFNNEFKDFKFFIVVKKNTKKDIKNFLIKNNMKKNINLIELHSRIYCRKLAEVKYLINNSTFPTYFIKKEGQKYINTWHGTPLKTLGRSIKSSPNELGNTQRNFLMSDYLIYPNKFTFERMKKDYMLDNLYKGEYLISGYPRNSIFFDNNSRNKIIEELELQDKKILVYMPTWRGTLNKKDNSMQHHYLMYILLQIDNSLNSDTILYVKLHNYVDSIIDYKEFKHIRQFPKEYETYEFINVADCLITDYSSVFFDFANTGKEIILFTYDKEEYFENRGTYLKLEDLPFKQTNNIYELLNYIKNIKHNKDHEYIQFKDEYCKHDNINVTKELCEYVFENKKSNNMEIIRGETFKNKKENVLIFAGALQKNGITSALKGLLDNINLEEKNYYLLFYKNKVEKNKYIINEFDKRVSYMVIQGPKNFTLKEIFSSFLYFRMKKNNKWIKSALNDIYLREIKRLFPNINFDFVIHYSGYEGQIMELFNRMNSKKMIYIHSNMLEEERRKHNFNVNSLKMCYKDYDKIVIVRPSMKEEILKYVKNIDENKICLAHNLNNINYIKRKSREEITFDKDTYCNYDIDLIKSVIENKNITKFINIARYSPEKGIERLILAFEEYSKENKNSYLIIIGGYGKEFDNIRNLVLENSINNVIIIKSLSNPYPILAKSDLFILSSYYEGLPMTIMEALILDKPVISTSITGPKEFLEQGYGYLVDNSINGLLQGMKQYQKNKLKNLKKFEAEEFNQKAIEEFYKLFN